MGVDGAADLGNRALALHDGGHLGARAAGKDVGVGVFNLSGNGKALTMGENKGLVKFVFDKATDEILGFHVIGPRATDLAAAPGPS